MSKSVDRGSDEDQDRWLTELEAAEEAENFPEGGSVVLAESPDHALEIAEKLRAAGHRTIVRGVYVRTTCVLQEAKPPPSGLPSCMNCQQPFEAHTRLPGGDSACPDGKNTFNFEFQISPEVAEFVRANLDKPSDELARLWIERVRSKL